MAYDTASGVHTLLPQWVPQSSLRQRAGRAGRTSPGKCWHLVTKARATALPPSQAPEMLRTPLSEICLSASLLCASFNLSVEEFLLQAPSPPSQRAVAHALDVLNKVGAMTGKSVITEFGRLLSKISLEPRLAKMVLVSCCLGCLSPVLIVAGASDNRDPFMVPMNPAKRQQAREKHMDLGKGELGWAELLLRVYNGWLLSPNKRRFTDQNYLRPEALRLVQSVVTQIEGQLRSLRLVGPDSKAHLFSMDEANRNAGDIELVHCCLAAGLYPNIAIPIGGTKKSLETAAGTRVVANTLPASDRWVVYEKAARASGRQISLQNATAVSPLAVLSFSGQSLEGIDEAGPDDLDGEEIEDDMEDVWEDEGVSRTILTLDDWARVEMDPFASESLLCLREVWHRRFYDHVLGQGRKRKQTREEFDDFIVALESVLHADKRRHIR
mmetsp:Transcript_36042/g.94534  ORF Transcript_36042/g.94534 Transcript_36042/m.94534 type:complete len:440 (+) Transcript_36042:1-1320(+)